MLDFSGVQLSAAIQLGEILALDSQQASPGGFMITCVSSPLHEELSKEDAAPSRSFWRRFMSFRLDGQNIHESAALNTQRMGMSQKPMRP